MCFSLGKQVIIKSTNQLDLKLTWNQVRAMHKVNFFTIGGHSHTHVILSFLEKKSLDYELDTSLEMLSQKAGINPVHYSYPEGVVTLLQFKGNFRFKKNRGIKCCPTAIHGTNQFTTNTFELKRILVA